SPRNGARSAPAGRTGRARSRGRPRRARFHSGGGAPPACPARTRAPPARTDSRARGSGRPAGRSAGTLPGGSRNRSRPDLEAPRLTRADVERPRQARLEQRELEYFVDRLHRLDLEQLLHLVGDLHDVALIARRHEHRLHAGARRRRQLLLQPPDREHPATSLCTLGWPAYFSRFFTEILTGPPRPSTTSSAALRSTPWISRSSWRTPASRVYSPISRSSAASATPARSAVSPVSLS